ncbi:acetate kinase [Pseudoclavibacter sp. RFBJ3]|uniref:acetate/propionate family kinase n=1 Tax=unclassified Pseudoclavibacter TaxID=2615177 RepID=UPI000CE8F90F|nr:MULTISPECIES: acetate kinase [unclassified Pseudoclavibacter]PPF82709.1 acetate kinase [Pseudoclavibacter sp. RFBJ5]PPF91603.1 acetate kinase [Pseudoclavibacter sp. RFBJ3]PPF96499.1 acetate kinase [Pseudoclavibacter sp. RFBH5]PPG22273.1 acetate kinase [Pseudoclavibacter sp. RFBI4]
MSIVLVVNSGSSSFKYQLIDMDREETLASGLVERIGESVASVTHKTGGATFAREADIPNHTRGFEAMLEGFEEHGPSLAEFPPVVVGHRVVHGGRRFFDAAVIDGKVLQDIEDLIPLAPLHNPANLEGIVGARDVFAETPHVAVFDTAFHTTMSEASSLYALDAAVAKEHRVRKYGAHGTSHKFVSEETAGFLGRDLGELKTIVLHIGNGASMCAVDGGRSVETSMGMTPLEGLVMGTRTGDLDPAVLVHLSRRGGYTIDQLDDLLNRKSGLLGLTGSGDMRDVRQKANAGDERAQLGLAVYAHRIRHYLGAYMLLLGGVDAIVFTAGIGENDAQLRADVLEGLEWLGVKLSPERNESSSRDARRISADDSRIEVLVVPTNEELEIARQSLSAIA